MVFAKTRRVHWVVEQPLNSLFFHIVYVTDSIFKCEAKRTITNLGKLIHAHRETIQARCLAARQFGVGAPAGTDALAHWRIVLEELLEEGCGHQDGDPLAVIDVGGAQFADVWFMDDGQIATRSSSVDPWLRAFDAEAAVAGAARGRGERAKSVVAVIAPPGVAAAARPRWATDYALASVAPPADGPDPHVLGVDFGGGAVSDRFLAAADKVAAVHDALGLLEDTSAELVLMRRCADVCKAVHLLRAAGRLHFHTSDRLRSLPAGGFVYCGRAGALAKRGGAWVDLEAIEAAVGAVPGVCSAAVLGGDQVDIFVSFEPWSGEKTLCGVLDDVRRAAGGVCRVHARSELPLHPATAKVDRRRLKAELDEVRVREADHLARLASLQRKMLWSYCSWYAVPLSLLAVWTLLACALMPLVRVVDVLLARVLMLPYMWAALLYSILDPTRGVNFFQRPIGVPDFVLLLAMAVPHAPWCLGAATAASCAVVVWRRDKDVLAAGSFAALGIALWAAAGAQHLSCCASLLTCFIVAAVCAPKQLGFLAGLPVCFYVVLPKWLGDDWLWRVRCDESHLRRFLMRVMVAAERPSWDASLAWDDARSNAYWQNDYVQSCVRVKEECNGLAKAVDSLWEIPPVSSYTKATNGSSDKEREVHQGSAAADAPALSTAAASLAALVERAGGNPYALGSMDSLQEAITLAELIRREIGLQMPVSSVLNCADVVQLAQRAEEASQVLDKGINGATSTRARPRLGPRSRQRGPAGLPGCVPRVCPGVSAAPS
ncbi:unnamed protein product [Prorocentrum cordatum]|uniref:Uncharacterized protein n=1 Tax=Prorocentrum cordatum TaxID=2364126 RepID=A0ABN9X0A6_9DINO|nr:unnamed protein product [Polarella glacialis]